MNIYSGSKDWRCRILSNFAHTPFNIEINKIVYNCNSVEGFWQGLKSKDQRRLSTFLLSGMNAKRAGSGKKFTKFEISGETFKVGSKEHENLIREAIKNKILQNEKAFVALKSSSGVITHKIPSKTKPLFKMEKMLMSIRKELFDY